MAYNWTPRVLNAWNFLMINFWFEVIEVENGYQGKPVYVGVVKANSDTIMTTDEFVIKENATFACEYFIKGIDFARNSL